MNNKRYLRRAWGTWLGLLALLTVLPSIASHTEAQSRLCFAETGQCIEGRFREFWQNNGGLPVFGFPITPARDELNRDTGQRYLTQWFERNRFELHPELAAPYDVLLGRLGEDRLLQQGVIWQNLPRASGPQADCLWFEQTRQTVCDQQAGRGFKTYWESHGLLDPRLDSYRRSLALWGLPLSSPRIETNSSGDTVITQWFERARFEWHPANPEPYQVLLGLLGNEVRAYTPGAPTVTTTPTTRTATPTASRTPSATVTRTAVATVTPTSSATATPTATLTPSATTTSTATPTQDAGPAWQRPLESANWLEVLNAYRATGNLPPVREDVDASAGCRLHARYIVETGTLTHFEDPASPWYTSEGDRAARESVLNGSYNNYEPDRHGVETFLATVFHAVDALSPELSTSGYGSYGRAEDRPNFTYPDFGECMNVLRGLTTAPSTTRYPLTWPVDGGVQPFLEGRGEWPDPLGTCGFTWPVGGYIRLQLDQPIQPGTSGVLQTMTGQRLDACVYDQHTYGNADPQQQDFGRGSLASHRTVVLIPRQPLTPSTRYQVTLTVNGTTYTWTFTTVRASQRGT